MQTRSNINDNIEQTFTVMAQQSCYINILSIPKDSREEFNQLLVRPKIEGNKNTYQPQMDVCDYGHLLSLGKQLFQQLQRTNMLKGCWRVGMQTACIEKAHLKYYNSSGKVRSVPQQLYLGRTLFNSTKNFISSIDNYTQARGPPVSKLFQLSRQIHRAIHKKTMLNTFMD